MTEEKAKYEVNNFVSMGEFESSNVAELHWNAEAEQLLAVFNTGARYVYFHVAPEVIAKLSRAISNEELSVGKTFNGLVKQGGFEYQRIDDVTVEAEEDIQTQVAQRYLSGVEVGMLWFDNDPDNHINDKIVRGVEYYRDKYGVHPYQHIEVLISEADFPEDVLPEEEFVIGNITVILDKIILPFHYLIGVAHV